MPHACRVSSCMCCVSLAPSLCPSLRGRLGTSFGMCQPHRPIDRWPLQPNHKVVMYRSRSIFFLICGHFSKFSFQETKKWFGTIRLKWKTPYGLCYIGCVHINCTIIYICLHLRSLPQICVSVSGYTIHEPVYIAIHL